MRRSFRVATGLFQFLLQTPELFQLLLLQNLQRLGLSQLVEVLLETRESVLQLSIPGFAQRFEAADSGTGSPARYALRQVVQLTLHGGETRFEMCGPRVVRGAVCGLRIGS